MTRCTINPITHVAGIHPRIVTSCAFSELRAFASFMIQSAVKIHAPTETNIKRTYKTQQVNPRPAAPAAAATSSALGEFRGVAAGDCANRFVRLRSVRAAKTNRFMTEISRMRRLPLSTQLAASFAENRGLRTRESPRLLTTAAAIKIFARKVYGFGEPGTIFGRVIKCTISPMTVVNGIQASTVTRVALGELRRFASFITQIAMKSQIASEINGIRIPAPQIAAIAPPLISGVGVTSCARIAEETKTNGEPIKSRFMAG